MINYLDTLPVSEQEKLKKTIAIQREIAELTSTYAQEAKAALDQFKMQAASEVGVTLNQNGYNGNLTSKQAGSIGGQMVKKMVESYENSIKGTK